MKRAPCFECGNDVNARPRHAEVLFEVLFEDVVYFHPLCRVEYFARTLTALAKVERREEAAWPTS